MLLHKAAARSVPHPRRQARILAMQALYQMDVQGEAFAPDLDGFLESRTENPSVIDYARRLVTGAWAEKARFDRDMTAAARHWSVDRMPGVDRNIIRVALYEMRVCTEPPAKVAINEAIEIAKEFGARESPQFVNGILDAILRSDRESPPPTDVPGEPS